MDFETEIKELYFNYGWCCNKKIIFLGKENDIQVVFDAYTEDEKINSIQKKSFIEFYSKKEEFSILTIKEIDKYIQIYVDGEYTIDDILIKEIFIKQDGKLILLCEVSWDIENGLGIQLKPDFEIGPQDTFI